GGGHRLGELGAGPVERSHRARRAGQNRQDRDRAAGSEAVMRHEQGAASDSTTDDADRHHRAYIEALAGVRHAIAQLNGCSAAEKEALARELGARQGISEKLEMGRAEIVPFGEIETGKSALINALVGRPVADVDVRGGWTKEVWSPSWGGCGYVVPG